MYTAPSSCYIRGDVCRNSIAHVVRWTGWLVQVSEAEGPRCLAVMVVMVHLVGGRQAVAVSQDDGGWAHRWGASGGGAVGVSRPHLLLAGILSHEVAPPFGPRILEPHLHERWQTTLHSHGVLGTNRVKWTRNGNATIMTSRLWKYLSDVRLKEPATPPSYFFLYYL